MVGMWPTDFHSLLVSGGGHKELSWSNCIRGEDFVPPLLQQWARMTRKFFFFSGSFFREWLVGWLSLGQIEKTLTPVFFLKISNENAKRGIQQKLLRFGYNDFFWGFWNLELLRYFACTQLCCWARHVSQQTCPTTVNTQQQTLSLCMSWYSFEPRVISFCEGFRVFIFGAYINIRLYIHRVCGWDTKNRYLYAVHIYIYYRDYWRYLLESFARWNKKSAYSWLVHWRIFFVCSISSIDSLCEGSPIHNLLVVSSLLGEMIQFDDHIFQMGWNHQPDNKKIGLK